MATPSTFIYPTNDESAVCQMIANDELLICLGDRLDHGAQRRGRNKEEPCVSVLHKASNRWLEDVSFSQEFLNSVGFLADRQTLWLLGFLSRRSFILLQHWHLSTDVSIDLHVCWLEETSNTILVRRSSTILQLPDVEARFPYGIRATLFRPDGAAWYLMMTTYEDRGGGGGYGRRRPTHLEHRLFEMNGHDMEARQVAELEAEVEADALTRTGSFVVTVTDGAMLITTHADRLHLYGYERSRGQLVDLRSVPMNDVSGIRDVCAVEQRLIVFTAKSATIFDLSSPELSASHTLNLDFAPLNAASTLWRPFVLADGEIMLSITRPKYRSDIMRGWLTNEIWSWRRLQPPRLAELALRAVHRNIAGIRQLQNGRLLHPLRVRNALGLADLALTPMYFFF